MSSNHWNQLKNLQALLESVKVSCIKLQSETLLLGNKIAIWRKCITAMKKISNKIAKKLVKTMDKYYFLIVTVLKSA